MYCTCSFLNKEGCEKLLAVAPQVCSHLQTSLAACTLQELRRQPGLAALAGTGCTGHVTFHTVLDCLLDSVNSADDYALEKCGGISLHLLSTAFFMRRS